MLIEVKVKVARVIDGKLRRRIETFVVDNCDMFVNAEYAVHDELTSQIAPEGVDSFEMQSLKISSIKEVATQFTGEFTFVATLKDIWLEDDGTEKTLKYKVLLWADDLTQANQHISQLAKQGYDMQIEGIKQVDYEYLPSIDPQQ